jgi:beta-xylosidase
MKSLFITLAGSLLVYATSQAAPLKSFRPGEIWPDNHGVHINAHGGGILFHKGTYYWFGEHKVEGGIGNTAQVGVHVYSSKDLYNWNDEGIALRVSDDPKSDITKGCILERPKVIFNARTGKFVMWFHLELVGHGYSAARSGVAVADKVTGPFTLIESFRPNASVWPDNVPEEMKKPLSSEESDKLSKVGMPGDFVPEFAKGWVFRRDHAGGQMARDMTLFVDDDGKAYHIHASEENATLHISLLSDDYLKPVGKFIRVFPLDFNEAPALFKRNGKYFMIASGCTSWNPNPARSAVADSIWGPWKALGNPCVGTEEQKKITFGSQSTFVLPVQGKKDAFIFMGDRWRPENAIDGRYVWLPVQFKQDGMPFLEWKDEWDLGFFESGSSNER